MKFQLGKTPEELEKEQALKQRQREMDIQKAAQERQEKIAALNAKYKKNKVILILIIILVSSTLLFFGIYNTFFKHQLSQNDVSVIASQQINKYPDEGISNYIRDNAESLFNKYANTLETDVKSIHLNKDSVYISKILKYSNTIAQVYFCADVETTDYNKTITDEDFINTLKTLGLTKKHRVTTSATEEDPNVSTSDMNGSTEDDTDLVSITEDDTVEETTQNSQNIGTILTQEKYEYYINGDDDVIQIGKTKTSRYCFCVMVEWYYTYDNNNQPLTGGYKITSPLSLYSLIDINQTDFEKVEESRALSFEDVELYDEQTTESAKIKVDKTLDDLYSGKDTSQDFINCKQFNTYGAIYNGIDSFMIYKGDNYLGYNAKITYLLETKQGFNYTIDTYMKVEQSGSSWIITDIL